MVKFNDDNQEIDQPPADQTDQESQQLVAYLDGELDDEVSREVERRLMDDAAYRQRLQQLQQTWDLLDELPRANRDESFTRSTVEFVALKAQEDMKETRALLQPGNRRTLVIRWLIILVAALLGWLLGDWYYGREHRALLDDLEVIAEYEQYRLTEDFEFLEKLEASGVFDEEAPGS